MAQMSQRKPNLTTPINKAQIAYYTSTQTSKENFL